MVSELETTPQVGDDRLTPASSCALLADFIDVLLPGDGAWPSARNVGVQAYVAVRLLEERGKVSLPGVMKALLDAGGPLEGLDEAARIDVVKRFEAAEPAVFGWLRDAAYVAYYENPFVAEAINAKGCSVRVAASHQRLPASQLRKGARHAAPWPRPLYRRIRCDRSTPPHWISRAIARKPGD